MLLLHLNNVSLHRLHRWVPKEEYLNRILLTKNPFYSVYVCVNTTCNLPTKKKKFSLRFKRNKIDPIERRKTMKLTFRCSRSYRRFSSSRNFFESFLCSINSLSKSSMIVRRNCSAFELIAVAKCDHCKKTSREIYEKRKTLKRLILLFVYCSNWMGINRPCNSICTSS